MNKRLKEVCKKIAYGTIKRLDILSPALSACCVRRFYQFRALNDLRLDTVQPYDSLGTYVTMYSQKPRFYQRFRNTYKLDAEGIPLYIYEGETSYQVVQLAQFGLMEYGYYCSSKNLVHRESCLRCAEKLLTLQDDRGGWPCAFDYPCPEVNSLLKAGWYTAMGQGQAISLLARAESLQHKDEYRIAAHRALALLEVPIQQGGVLKKIGPFDFYEEYPTETPSYTLNGLIFCMIGLYDGYRVFEDKQAHTMYCKMLETLRYILPLYDDETVTAYDLSHLTNPPRQKLRSHKYHILHIKLLQAVNDLSPDELFAFYIQKWSGKKERRR